MTIERAIEIRNHAKKAGNENVVLAFWTADAFDMKEGGDWAAATEVADDMDWSRTHEDIKYAIENN